MNMTILSPTLDLNMMLSRVSVTRATAPARRLQQRRALSASTDLILVERHPLPKEGEYAVVRLNNAPVNTLSPEMVHLLASTVRGLERDGVRGMVLGSSQKAFSAGMDLKEFYGVSAERFGAYWTAVEDMWHTLYMSPLATVAAIESHAPAGGSILALSCDYRVLADVDGLRMGLNETQLGMVCPRWLQAMCARTVGERRAERLLQSGMMMTPPQAKEFGFVDELQPKDDVMGRATEVLLELAALPPRARAATKQQQRAHAAALTGPASKEELWGFLQSDECQRALDQAFRGAQEQKPEARARN